MKKQITYTIMVPVPGKMAEKKPDIIATSKNKAKIIAAALYGCNVIVIDPL